MVSGAGQQYVLYLLIPGQKPVRVERSFTPVPVSATERSERREQITQVMRRLNQSWSWTGPEIPDVKPAYRDFTIAEDGRIWVRVYTPGEPIPADELPPVPPGPNPPIRLTTREPNLYDVFSPDGRLLGRVAPPPRTRLLRMRGNQAWGVQLDSLDVPYAVRFRGRPGAPELGNFRASGEGRRKARPHGLAPFILHPPSAVKRKICDALLSLRAASIDCLGVDFASAPSRRTVPS